MLIIKQYTIPTTPNDKTPTKLSIIPNNVLKTIQGFLSLYASQHRP